MKNNILITGVNGFIGSSLLKELLIQNHSVVGICNKSCDRIKQFINHQNFTLLKDGISTKNLNSLDNFNIIGVYHLASKQPGGTNENYASFYEANVKTTALLINYFKLKNKLDFFIFTSTISVFGKEIKSPINESEIPEPKNNYSLTKYISEKIIEFESEDFSRRSIVLRLQSVFGKNDGYGILNFFNIKSSKNEPIELYSQGKIFRNLIIIEDVVSVLTLITKKLENLDKFEIFQIASQNSLSTYEMASIVKKLKDSSSKIIRSKQKFEYDWNVFVDISKAKEKLNFFSKQT